MPTIIRGTPGINVSYLDGTTADEKLVGDAGEDWITGYGGHDDAYGGRGNDVIDLGAGNGSGTGRGLGGVGDDSLFGTSGYVMAGGSGDDVVGGNGRLYGDERPGLAQRTVGNDYLTTELSYGGHATQTGGRGADTFNVGAYHDGAASSVRVTDFAAGQDKLSLGLGYSDGVSPSLNGATIWSALDSNGNGRLGDDVPWTDNATVTVGSDGLTIRLHEDTVTLAGIDSLSASDWAF